MQLVTTVLKFVPLAVIGIVGLFFVRGGNYKPFIHSFMVMVYDYLVACWHVDVSFYWYCSIICS